MANGWIGVDLFFVLSGLLITQHIARVFERDDEPWHWRPYLAKRMLRIVPSYYAVLLLVFVGVFPNYAVAAGNEVARLVYHLLFLQDYLPANFVVAFWSLGVEEKFYLMAPVLLLVLMKLRSMRQRLLVLVGMLAASVLVRTVTASVVEIDNYYAYFRYLRSPFHMTLDPILVGVALAIIYRARDDLPRLTSRVVSHSVFWFGTLTILGLAVTHQMMADITWWDRTLQPLVIALGFGAITFGLLFGGGPPRVFESLSLFFVARISYSWYLIHMPLIPMVFLAVDRYSTMAGQFGFFMFAYLLVTLLGALLLHYVVEKPFLNLKSRIR